MQEKSKFHLLSSKEHVRIPFEMTGKFQIANSKFQHIIRSMNADKNTPKWLDEGLQNIWLPYAQMQTAPTPLPVSHTSGTKIILDDGRELIDGISSWWSACHGYNHPHIISEMEKQLKIMPHVMFAGLAHKPAYHLANRLAKITPEGLNHVFFSDSGSVAVEVAMKMAAQYWHNKGDHKRNRFICFKNGYHGDTMGAMSLADPDDGMHKAFTKYMPKQYVMEIPTGEYSLAEFEELLEGISKTTAALIIEPLVQGAGGLKFYSADILAEIRRLCAKYEILFIADEIATGFMRTGSMFACDEAGITPDIMCVGKSLTGGAIGLAATIATDKVFDAFLSDNLENALMHGPTYMANPLACAAANASLDLFEREDYISKIEAIENQLREGLAPCKSLENVADVRVKGAIGVVQLKNADWGYMFELREKFITKGVWLRPFGDIIYIMPAFTIENEDLSKLTSTICKILK